MTTSLDRLSRCRCPHRQWTDLVGCLLSHYQEQVDELRVLEELQLAHAAVTRLIPLDTPDQMEMAELIARNRLEITCGRRPDAARLDPQHHERGARSALPGEPLPTGTGAAG